MNRKAIRKRLIKSVDGECPVCGSTNIGINDNDINPQIDYPLGECKNCGSEWNIDGEITLNARKIK